MIKAIRLYVLTTVALLMVACVQLTSMPGYARPGDTIILGMGGVHRNAGSSVIPDKNNIVVTLTDSNGIKHNLYVELMFRSYPDHMSGLTVAAVTNRLGTTDLEPYDGGWFVVASLIDSNNAPLSTIAPGAASIEIVSTQFVNTKTAYEGDITQIPIEILSGASQYNPQYIQQLVLYTSNSTKLIEPQGLVNEDVVGAAFYRLSYSNVDSLIIGPGLQNGTIDIHVVPANHNPFVQISSNVVDNGDGTGYVDIYLLNPYGFSAVKQGSRRSSLHADLAVQFELLAPTSEWDNAVLQLDMTKSQYYDLNGNVMSGVTPNLQL